MFIVLLSYSESLATKCLFLNDESCMVRPTLIDLNPVDLKYYSLMISLDIIISLDKFVMSYLQKDVFKKKQKT